MNVPDMIVEMAPTEVTLVSRPRTVPSVVHAWGEYQTWCGRKMRNAWQRPGTMDEVTCDACRRAVEANRPRSWRRR